MAITQYAGSPFRKFTSLAWPVNVLKRRVLSAAFQPDCRATACFYGTGIHNGKLGRDADAGSLQRAGEMRGPLLLVWGSQDPHIPAEGRAKVEETLRAKGRTFSVRHYPAEHAFMRDEGPRFDPEAADQAFADAVAFYRSVF